LVLRHVSAAGAVDYMSLVGGTREGAISLIRSVKLLQPAWS